MDLLKFVKFGRPGHSARVAVIGGGTAGLSVASQLGRHLTDVTVIDKSTTHFYQPLWLLSAAGLKDYSDTYRQMVDVMPKNSQWIQDSVTHIDPEKSVLELSSGKFIPYDALVVAPGLVMNWEKVQGLDSIEHLQDSDSVFSIYNGQYNDKGMPRALKEFKGGQAVFTQPSTPVKCAGAPQKILYLTEEMSRKNGVREKCQFDFYSGMRKIFSIDKYAQSLTQVCQSRHIGIHLSHDLISIDQSKKEATFKILSNFKDEKIVKVSYDLLHITPPMGPPPFLKNIGNADGWVDVDKYTTQHVKFDNIFSLGDASSLPTSKTAAAIASQSKVTAQNLLSFLSGKALTAKYDGYTSCPLITGEHKVILAEFSGYTQETMETFPFDQSKEHWLPYWLVKDILPTVYWSGMLRGLWKGPGVLRKILNPTGK